MDARAHERPRPQLHGLVKDAGPGWPVAHLLVPLALAGLLCGVLGGLLRLGVGPAEPPAWLGRAGLHHAALMICAFMGTVIGVERAVAVKKPLAWAPPFASGAGGVLLLLGLETAGQWLLVAASLGFIGVNLVVVLRQWAPHTLLLLASAFAWLAGNLLFALGFAGGAILPWWFAFLVMTIAAERLEMTRLMRRRPGAQTSLYALLAALGLAASAAGLWPATGNVAYGAVLVLLAVWLLVFDIARRTVRADGLARYMAVCLLGGYLWLAVSGLAWIATALGLPARDLALHALGLGFIVSMMMGHAPVILPAIARVKLLFGPFFYLPLAALHLSLVVRFAPGAADFWWRAQGGLANALAIAFFAATVGGAAWAWRRKHPA